MNQNEKTPTVEQTVEASNMSGGDSSEYITTDVVCVAETEKGVLLKSKKSNDELWFAKKQLEIISGEYGKGMELTVKIKQHIIQRARQNKAAKQDVRFTDQVRVVGYAKYQTPKAYIVVCDADGATRPLAKSKITSIKTDFIDGEAVELVVPAWMLKRQDNTFPSWVQGARL